MTTTSALRKQLVVEQTDLDPGVVILFREFDDKIRMAYDPAQVPPVVFDREQSGSMAARQMLGMYHMWTEGPVLDAWRESYNSEPVGSPLRELIGIVFDEIDRTQDPAGVAKQCLSLFATARHGRLATEHGPAAPALEAQG
ncbi:hypothetical protein [Streptomyces phaeochromogenes]|uniref:hypothetical protein n=1 Tax=Streptomyces phaeochromogenes TaxID=1923 RepID=UPI002DD9E3B3|nr:hypothetical protein [Streptomyces phaeochromogenes]WRZ31366.1 hypothetical protein OG931_28280 [Streptomyces phaeochromogenes]